MINNIRLCVQVLITICIFGLSPKLLAAQPSQDSLNLAGSIEGICNAVTVRSDSYQDCMKSGASSFKVYACGKTTKRESFIGCLNSPANADQALACDQAATLQDTYLKCLEVANTRKLLYVEILYCHRITSLGPSLIACLNSTQLGNH